MSQYTVGSLIQSVSEQFGGADLVYGHGTDNAWDEAVLLVLTVTGAQDDEAELGREVPLAVATDIADIAQVRIKQRVPLVYLLRQCQYMGYTFQLQPGVIVPRSPIGYLLADGLAPWLPAEVGHIVDLCCGTGCLGIVAAHLFPQARVTLVDLDELACDVARANVHQHGLEDRATVIQADVTTGLGDLTAADLVLCNPPYVNAVDMDALPREYRAEPATGLAAGADGLQILTPILARVPALLTATGLFVGEVGASAPALLRAFPQLPFIWPDLPQGGEGVFLLEAAALSSHTARQ